MQLAIITRSRLMEPQDSKALVHRLVEIVNAGDLDALDEVADGQIADAARSWIGPFRGSFPDFRMEVQDLVAEDDKVVGHFKCSGTTGANGAATRRPGAGSRTWMRSTSSASPRASSPP